MILSHRVLEINGRDLVEQKKMFPVNHLQYICEAVSASTPSFRKSVLRCLSEQVPDAEHFDGSRNRPERRPVASLRSWAIAKIGSRGAGPGGFIQVTWTSAAMHPAPKPVQLREELGIARGQIVGAGPGVVPPTATLNSA